MIGDGKGIPITHIGSTSLDSPTSTFRFNDVLCAPHIKQNLISVSQFCSQNKASIEFFPDFFLVKDLSTGESLVRGRNRGNIYEWPTTSSSHHTKPTAFAIFTVSTDTWHHRLGHPSSQVLKKLAACYSLPVITSVSSFAYCDACFCNKSQRRPFRTSSISCTQPLEVLFIDVWGPAPFISFDHYCY